MPSQKTFLTGKWVLVSFRFLAGRLPKGMELRSRS